MILYCIRYIFGSMTCFNVLIKILFQLCINGDNSLSHFICDGCVVDSVLFINALYIGLQPFCSFKSIFI